MDIPILSNLLRRSRHRSLVDRTEWENRQVEPRFYASLNEYDPAQLASLESVASVQSVESASLAALASNAAAAAAANAATTTKKKAAQAATVGTTRSDSAASLTYPAPSTASTTSTSSTVTSLSSSSTRISSSSTLTTSSFISTTITSAPTPVLTITSLLAVASSSSSLTDSSSLNTTLANAASQSTTTTGLSTGGIVGIALAVIFGVVIIGTGIGWAYRKHTSKTWGDAPWSNIPDNDVTPFPRDAKDREPSFDGTNGGDSTDYFAAAPPIRGSRRALALARQNAFNPDGSLRPNSEIMIQREGNRAGLGAGMGAYSSYPVTRPGEYGVDAQGRPYNGQAGRAPMPHMMNDYETTVDDLVSISPPSNSRQLLGPGPQVTAVPMGRPEAPEQEIDLMQHEAYGDILDTYDDHFYTAPKAPHQQVNTFNAQPTSMPLPALTPLSPLMGGFMAAQQQNRPYGEITQPHVGVLNNSTSTQATTSSFSAHAPSLMETITPIIRLPPQSQTQPQPQTQTQSRPLPAAPTQTQTLIPPPPFQHGRPLSPLVEVQTPLSAMTNTTTNPTHLSHLASPTSPGGASNSPSPIPSSNIHEYNPFANLPLPTRPSPAVTTGDANAGMAAPPYSARSNTSFPTPRFPPPSPGGMSVPGSVGGSPGQSPPRWVDGNNGRGRALSMYDEEDAYGGI